MPPDDPCKLKTLYKTLCLGIPKLGGEGRGVDNEREC